MIFSIDPGSDKTGIALLREDGSLSFRRIIPSETMEETVKDVVLHHPVESIVMGNGTHHKEMQERIRKALDSLKKDIPIHLVNEKFTTEMAKQRYWKENKPKGINRFLPAGMRTVPVPVDDYAAEIMALIYLGKIRPEDVGHKKV
jgi:RNase H-fold protein (predicted Holliday junction resolvase)